MTIKARWKPSDDEKHLDNIALQKSLGQLEQLLSRNEVTVFLRIWHDTTPKNISELLGIEAHDSSQKDDLLAIAGRWDRGWHNDTYYKRRKLPSSHICNSLAH